jgi:C4-dicarboxylate transporter, DctQ subunit
MAVARARWIQEVAASIGAGMEKLILAVATGLLAMVALTLFLEVLFRYALVQPLPWTEEAARFGLVWLTMLAAAVSARRGLHFSFRWVTLALPLPARIALRQTLNIATIVFLVIVFMQSITYLDVVSNQTAIATQVPMWVPYSGITVGVTLIILFYCLELVDAACAILTRRILSERERTEASVYRLLAAELPAEDLIREPVVSVR